MPEPRININGERLTDGEAMTVRAAIEAFAADLTSDDPEAGTGDVKMNQGYLMCIQEIRRMLFNV